MSEPTPTTTQGSGDRPDCSFCLSDVADRAEQDRQHRLEALALFAADTLALVDRAEIQAAAAMVRMSRGTL